jgi:hypothetical protein
MNNRKNNRWVLVLAAALVWGAGDAAAQGSVVVEERFPTQEERVRLFVVDQAGKPVAGASIEVTYRPESSVRRIETIGKSGQSGSIDWVPTEAGIATLKAAWTGPDRSEMIATADVSVRFRSPPIGGILIMIIAGIVLVVGSVIRMYNVIRTPQAP